MTGQKCGGLWRLNLSTLNQPNAANFVTTTSTNDQGLSKPTLALQRWNARLGHVSVYIIQKLSSQELVSGVPSFEKTTPHVCSSCAFG